MTMQARLLLVALAMGALGGCVWPTEPTRSAYSRNVGFGSAVGGQARSDLGSYNSGNTYVPGAPAAGGIGGNGGGGH